MLASIGLDVWHEIRRRCPGDGGFHASARADGARDTD